LKNGWLARGWLVTLLALVIVWKFVGWGPILLVATFVEDFKDEAVSIYLPFFAPLENFFKRGLDCCCSSVKTGLLAITFD
jgi:hypothetical protein